MNTYYVVAWDFELEQSGEVVRDGVVFTDLEPAEAEASKALLASIDVEFGARCEPSFSRRLGQSGYITGETSVQEIESRGINEALQEALAGMGREVT